MPRRSQKAYNFVNGVDNFIETTTRLLKRRNAYKRITRAKHPQGKVSELEGLPSPKVALDWHDPALFNKLPAYIRALYINSPIALPLESVMEESDAWMDLTMSDQEFMEKFGSAVRAQYEFPTEEEVYAMKHGALNEDSEAEEENGYDADVGAGEEDSNGEDEDEDMEDLNGAAGEEADQQAQDEEDQDEEDQDYQNDAGMDDQEDTGVDSGDAETEYEDMEDVEN